jgi:uncharacterized protein YceH (UPF0502 family)
MTRYPILMNLSLTEARVLGCLIEKEITTPEYYPLSLNALVNACNQKSNREPVMELTETDVRTALFELDQMALVRTIADGRVSKFEHRVRDGLGAPGSALRRDEVAVVCLLLLRGPQTSAELRARAERLYAFEDNAATIATLERLAAREEPLTVILPRQPGSREARWMHLLCGSLDVAAMPVAGVSGAVSGAAGSQPGGLAERVSALEAMVESLDARLRRLEKAGSDGETAEQVE